MSFLAAKAEKEDCNSRKRTKVRRDDPEGGRSCDPEEDGKRTRVRRDDPE